MNAPPRASMPAPAPAAGRASGARPTLNWRALIMVGALLLIWVVFSATTHGTFLSPRNLSLLARQMSVTALLAAGMVLVIVAGQIDLSVGALSGLLGAVAALLLVKSGWPLPLAIAAALAGGATIGALQGSLVAWLRIPPFIVTLGGMLVCQGALLGLTGGVSTTPTPAFLRVGQSYLPAVGGWIVAGGLTLLFLRRATEGVRRREAGAGAAAWRMAGLVLLTVVVTAVMNAYEGVPIPVLLLLVIAGVLALVAGRTPFGRHLYAIGGNREAAFYAGVPIERRIVGVFALMGLLCGMAGVVLTARVGAATSDAGRMMELDAIAAAVIGGTSLLGGQGSVWGALLGAVVMASLDNGMSLMNTEAFWQPILKGGILVAAVAADMAGRRRG